ncbi:hypothetical protein FACS1894105_12090 [Clostridia bacterium]|nr:hypothetical protein FACS1894105_12090 [Clostridia bacterium]
MSETYSNFISSLDGDGQAVAEGIDTFISENYPEYKPVDIRKNSKSGEWTVNYRKKPKVGKAICTLESLDGKLRIRFCFLSSAVHEFLLKQGEFSNNIRKQVLKQVICSVKSSCHSYGGNTPCPYQQYFLVNHRLIIACPYPWVYLDSLTAENADDIRLLVRLQINNMKQDAKDIKGGTYADENKAKCGEVKLISFEETILDIDEYQLSDYITNPARVEKYAVLYNLVPLGGHDGAWFCQNDAAILEKDSDAGAYSLQTIPQGLYATVTVSNPMTFSANRVWNYICKWVKQEELSIAELSDTVCFARFYTAYGTEYMDMLVPVKAKSKGEKLS